MQRQERHRARAQNRVKGAEVGNRTGRSVKRARGSSLLPSQGEKESERNATLCACGAHWYQMYPRQSDKGARNGMANTPQTSFTVACTEYWQRFALPGYCGNANRTLAYLVANQDRSGRIFRSHARIADSVGCTQRTIGSINTRPREARTRPAVSAALPQRRTAAERLHPRTPQRDPATVGRGSRQGSLIRQGGELDGQPASGQARRGRRDHHRS